MKKGFTLIELIITVAIVGVLSSIVMFSVNVYLSKGKDANISSNLAVLIPAGEVYYTGNGSYLDFCDPDENSILSNSYDQMPFPTENQNCSGGLTSGLCCFVNVAGDAWAACAQKFSGENTAFCVDSRGVRRDITNDQCISLNTQSPLQCP